MSDQKTSIFVPSDSSTDGTKLLQNFNIQVTQSVQDRGLKFAVTRSNYTQPLADEIKYLEDPGTSGNVSLYVTAPNTNNNLYESIVQKFQQEVDYAKEVYVDNTDTANPLAAERPLEGGVHTIEEIYLPSGLTINGWNFLTDYVYIKGMNGGAPFYRRFKFKGDGRVCMIGEDLHADAATAQSIMKLNTIRLRPSGFSMFEHIETKLVSEWVEALVGGTPVVDRIFIPAGVTAESGPNQWDETKHLIFRWGPVNYRIKLAGHPEVTQISHDQNVDLIDCVEVFRDPTLTPAQKLIETFVSDRKMMHQHYITHVESIWQNDVDPERYIFVYQKQDTGSKLLFEACNLSGSSAGNTEYTTGVDPTSFYGYGNEFDAYTNIYKMEFYGTDVTVPKMTRGVTGVGGPFSVESSNGSGDGWQLFDKDFKVSHAFMGFVDKHNMSAYDGWTQTPDESTTNTPHKFALTEGGTDYSYGGWVRMDFSEATSFNAYRLAGPYYGSAVNLRFYAKAITLFGLDEGTENSPGQWTQLGSASNLWHIDNRGLDFHSHRYDLGETRTYKSVILQMKMTHGGAYGSLSQFQLLMH